MKRTLPKLVLVRCGIALLLCLTACTDDENAVTYSQKATAQVKTPARQSPQDTRTDATRKMAARLLALDETINWTRIASTASKKRIAEHRRRLAGVHDFGSRLVIKSRLAYELLNAGRTEEAIAQYEELKHLMSENNAGGNAGLEKELLELRGIAYLRLGEQQNCIVNHTADSCLVPIQGEGRHQIKAGSNAAVAIFTEMLNLYPDHINARWLLNLAYMTLGKYPDSVPVQWLVPESAFRSDYDIQRFLDAAPGAGVETIGLSGGVVMDDLDGDGYLDLMVSDWAPEKQLRFFHNNADGTFAERTIAAGLEGITGGLNLIHADYDNDGLTDVFVPRGAWLGSDGRQPNSLLRNLGGGRFEDATEQAGLLSQFPTQTAAWADFDGDGFLDLFVGNETTGGARYPCELYHNNGDGTFSNVAVEVGLYRTGFVKAALWGDYNNDGRPDLFLSQFNESNVLYRNDGPQKEGGWHFEDVSAQAGIQWPLASFPAWFWDYDNDGWEDILVAPFAGFRFDGQSLAIIAADYLGERTVSEPSAVYRNNGDGTFTDLSKETGLDIPMLAMGANFGDLDNDGWLDAYFGTGDPYLGTLVPNRMFRGNRGQGFQDVTTSGGFGHIQKGHGIAFGDIDNDGDQDVYAVMGGAVEGDVYQNALFENPGHGNHWVTLRLVGKIANRSAIGARIKVRVDTPAGKRDIYVTVGTGGSFGSSSLQQEIGLGDANRIESIEIDWPANGSTTQVLNAVPMDRLLRVEEGATEVELASLPAYKLNRTVGAHHEHN